MMPTNSLPTSQSALAIAILSLTGTLLAGCNQATTTTSSQTTASTTTQTTTTSVSNASTPTASMTMTASAPVASVASGLPASGVAATASAGQVSQQFTGDSVVEKRLKEALPEIAYQTDNLSAQAQATNQAVFGKAPTPTATASQPSVTTNASATTSQTTASNAQGKVNQAQALNTKIQALLNWHQFAIGAVDGKWGKNTIKAMQEFQKAHNLTPTDKMNDETWQALSDNAALNSQPVLVNYTLTDADVNLPLVKIPGKAEDKAKLDAMGYERVTEALGEKFHIDEQYLKALNPQAKFEVGEVITVYNPGQPNLTPIARLVADKKQQMLYAYDAQNSLVAVYPTTVGSTATPSPTGTHKVINRVIKPNYTHTAKDSKEKTIIQPGPNNPVGLVWIGLDKDSYGIHGSPQPEAISRQASEGCVRLTNWDALALYGAIQDDAVVEFK